MQVGVRVIGTLVRSHCTTQHFGPYLDLRREVRSGPFRSIGWSRQALRHITFLQYCYSYFIICLKLDSFYFVLEGSGIGSIVFGLLVLSLREMLCYSTSWVESL